jgi:hypothetical protein
MAYKVVDKTKRARGNSPAMISYDFGCPKCRVYFEGLSYHSDALGKVVPLIHRECGTLCEKVIKPGSRMAIRGGEGNAIPQDIRKVWQKYWGLTDNDMKHVSRESIDREMKARGLNFVDASWDDSAHGSKRAAGQAVPLPPDTDDPNAVRDWNAKVYGREAVVEAEQEIRTMYDEASRLEKEGVRYDPLPTADTVDVHNTPHKIDLEQTVKELAAAPTVSSDRRHDLQGRLITGK